MNKLTATLAALLLSTSAWAADMQAGKTTLSLGFGPEQTVHHGDTTYKGTMNLVHGLTDSLGLGLQTETYQAQDHSHDVSTNTEVDAWYARNLGHVLTLRAGVGVGEHISNIKDFPFYAAYVQADVPVNAKLTVNAVQYRYRNAFDVRRGFESHQVGTGVTYAVTDSTSVSGKLYRRWDGDINPSTDGVGLGVSFKF